MQIPSPTSEEHFLPHLPRRRCSLCLAALSSCSALEPLSSVATATCCALPAERWSVAAACAQSSELRPAACSCFRGVRCCRGARVTNSPEAPGMAPDTRPRRETKTNERAQSKNVLKGSQSNRQPRASRGDACNMAKMGYKHHRCVWLLTGNTSHSLFSHASHALTCHSTCTDPNGLPSFPSACGARAYNLLPLHAPLGMPSKRTKKQMHPLTWSP